MKRLTIKQMEDFYRKMETGEAYVKGSFQAPGPDGRKKS